MQCMPHAVCIGSCGAAFVKLLRPLVTLQQAMEHSLGGTGAFQN